MTRILFGLAALSAIVATTSAQAPPASWLDRPSRPGTRPGAIRARGSRDQNVNESRESIVKRCRLTPPRSTAAERAVDAAGWIPFWNFDRQLVRDDVEIVGGMRGADGMCRPASYNIFVFVGGRFAGLLSPTHMTSRLDSSSGVVRLQPSGITAEFARYTSSDPLMLSLLAREVTYRIDRAPSGPVVVATQVGRESSRPTDRSHLVHERISAGGPPPLAMRRCARAGWRGRRRPRQADRDPEDRSISRSSHAAAKAEWEEVHRAHTRSSDATWRSRSCQPHFTSHPNGSRA